MPALFPLLGFLQDDAINVGTPRARLSITAQHKHQSGVHSQLGAVEQGQPIGQHLNTAFIQTVGRDNVHVLDLDVRDRVDGPTSKQKRTVGEGARGGEATERGKLERQNESDEGRGSHKRRRTRNTYESKLDWRVIGQHVKGMLANLGLWPRNWAFTGWVAQHCTHVLGLSGPRRLPSLVGGGLRECPLRSFQPHINKNQPRWCRALTWTPGMWSLDARTMTSEMSGCRFCTKSPQFAQKAA